MSNADPITLRLRALQKPIQRYLWVPQDAITFTPAVLSKIFGDGRALFAIATINQRPAYWLVQACSTWTSGLDYGAESDGPDFGEFTDQILEALEDEFGRGRCGYSGNSLFWPKRDRIRNCQCEECSDGRFRARWPMVDGYGGCSWTRRDWPAEFSTVQNPLHRVGNLLAEARLIKAECEGESAA